MRRENQAIFFFPNFPHATGAQYDAGRMTAKNAYPSMQGLVAARDSKSGRQLSCPPPPPPSQHLHAHNMHTTRPRSPTGNECVDKAARTKRHSFWHAKSDRQATRNRVDSSVDVPGHPCTGRAISTGGIEGDLRPRLSRGRRGPRLGLQTRPRTETRRKGSCCCDGRRARRSSRCLVERGTTTSQILRARYYSLGTRYDSGSRRNRRRQARLEPSQLTRMAHALFATKQ